MSRGAIAMCRPRKDDRAEHATSNPADPHTVDAGMIKVPRSPRHPTFSTPGLTQERLELDLEARHPPHALLSRALATSGSRTSSGTSRSAQGAVGSLVAATEAYAAKLISLSGLSRTRRISDARGGVIYSAGRSIRRRDGRPHRVCFDREQGSGPIAPYPVAREDGL